jgi:plastocyanin
MRKVSAAVLLLVAGVLGCGGSSGTTGPSGGGRTTSLVMRGSAFSPSPDTVTAGATVTWTNQDAFNHTVTSAPGSADTYTSGNVAGGATFSHTFNAAGTYAYYCTIHGTPTTGMRGTIVVR